MRDQYSVAFKFSICFIVSTLEITTNEATSSRGFGSLKNDRFVVYQRKYRHTTQNKQRFNFKPTHRDMLTCVIYREESFSTSVLDKINKVQQKASELTFLNYICYVFFNLLLQTITNILCHRQYLAIFCSHKEYVN